MIRTDQILKITADVEGMMRAKGYTNHYAEAFADGFHEGASWADSNPCCWHKYPDEKPTNEGRYLACDTKDNINVMWYNLDTEWYDYTPKIIIAWMELPQPPKFD